MLGPEGHHAPEAMGSVQAALVEYLDSFEPDARKPSLLPEFAAVVRDRAAVESWVLP